MKNCKHKHGVTLIEILIVLAVMAILASMVIGIAARIDNQAKEQLTEGTFALLESALQEYHEYTGEFPEQTDPNFANAAAHSEILYGELNRIPGSRNILENIDASLIEDRAGTADMLEIYDPWGVVLDYSYVTGDNFPVITSAGPDTIFETTADNITSR